MHLALVVLGWIVVGCATVRALHLAQRGLWVRMVMVASWAILAAGVTLLEMTGDSEGTWVRVIFTVGIVLGAGSFLAVRLTDGRD